jgi:hypothetical protein
VEEPEAGLGRAQGWAHNWIAQRGYSQAAQDGSRRRIQGGSSAYGGTGWRALDESRRNLARWARQGGTDQSKGSRGGRRTLGREGEMADAVEQSRAEQPKEETTTDTLKKRRGFRGALGRHSSYLDLASLLFSLLCGPCIAEMTPPPPAAVSRLALPRRLLARIDSHAIVKHQSSRRYLRPGRSPPDTLRLRHVSVPATTCDPQICPKIAPVQPNASPNSRWSLYQTRLWIYLVLSSPTARPGTRLLLSATAVGSANSGPGTRQSLPGPWFSS